MKPLFDENDEWTDAGHTVDREVLEALRTIANKWVSEQGYSSRHLQVIMQMAAVETCLLAFPKMSGIG